MLAAILPGVVPQARGNTRTREHAPQLDGAEDIVAELASITDVVKAVSASISVDPPKKSIVGPKAIKPTISRKPALPSKLNKQGTMPPTKSLFDVDDGSDDDSLFR